MDERRDSIWSIPVDWRDSYFVLFNIQIVICLGLVIWHEMSKAEAGTHFVAVLLNVGSGMAPLVVTIAA